jgi:hypothetical protein
MPVPLLLFHIPDKFFLHLRGSVAELDFSQRQRQRARGEASLSVFAQHLQPEYVFSFCEMES